MNVQSRTRLTIALLICATSVMAAAPAASPWQEGTHYRVSKAPAKPFVESTVIVTALVSYAYPETAPLVSDFQTWKTSMPGFVRMRIRCYARDAHSLALANLFYALETLKRPDLHARVFETLRGGKNPLVVMKTAQEVDDAQTIQTQASFLEQFGVPRADFQRAVADPANVRANQATVAQFAPHGDIAALPTVLVNDKYLTDSRSAPGKIVDVANHLIVLADLDNVVAGAASNGHLRDANNPVIGIWHTVVPNLFEVQRKSGIWYFDRSGEFGGNAILTDLDSGKVLSADGSARLSVTQAPSAMLAKTVWADKTTVALRGGAEAKEVTQNESVGFWSIRKKPDYEEFFYYLSADGRYHIVTASQQNDIDKSQKSRDELDAGSGFTEPPPPLKEGTGKPSTPEEKTRRVNTLAKIADTDAIVFSPSGPTRETLTVFLDPHCFHCRRLHHDTGKFTARGIKVRYVPVYRTPLSTNIWCARDRRAALANAMRVVSLWPVCAREAKDGFLPLYRDLNVAQAPSIINSRGEIVVGYVTAEETMRILVN